MTLGSSQQHLSLLWSLSTGYEVSSVTSGAFALQHKFTQ